MISSSSPIPKICYLYFPRGEELIYQAKNSKIRRIFDGNTMYEAFEKDHLSKFCPLMEKDEILKNQALTNGNIIRFLQAVNFNYVETIKNLKLYLTWKNSLKIDFLPSTAKILKEEIISVVGRDNRFRPIIIVKAKLLNDFKVSVEDFVNALIYVLEYMLQNMLLPGQIECWNVIMDLDGLGLFSLPKEAMKKALSEMQNCYRARLHKCYILNAPTSISILWNIAKLIMEETTINKIDIARSSSSEKMWTHINPSQVEKKYGGKLERSEKGVWPPKEVSENYFITGDDPNSILITKEFYQKMHSAELLKNNKVCPDLLVQILQCLYCYR